MKMDTKWKRMQNVEYPKNAISINRSGTFSARKCIYEHEYENDKSHDLIDNRNNKRGWLEWIRAPTINEMIAQYRLAFHMNDGIR